MRRRHTALLTALLVAACGALPVGAAAQSHDGPGALNLALELRQLDGVKRVLMIAAHPDDEDTSLLAELARGQGAETAYLSLTRGEGGQNLIGSELGEGLGIVRTGELLAARRIDGGQQFFSRAFDYGYSKTAVEALSLWPEDDLLGDVVWTVRRFRPHVIVSVFSGTPSDGHGQHQAAGIMAHRVFEAAADPSAYPEHFEHGLEPWQATTFYRLVRRNPESATTSVPTGTYDPLLGRSRFQVAMESRSQHRSQEMGASQGLGPRASNLELVHEGGMTTELASPESNDIRGFFAGVDTAIVSLAPSGQAGAGVRSTLEAYRTAIGRARDAFDPFDPSGVVPPLTDAAQALDQALVSLPTTSETDDARRTLSARRARVGAAALNAAGVTWDVRATDDLVVPGQTFRVDIEVWNGGPVALGRTDVDVSLPPGTEVTETEPPAPRGRFAFLRGPPPVTAPDPGAEWSDELSVSLDGVDVGGFARRSYFVRTGVATPTTRLYYLEQERAGVPYTWPERSELWGEPRNPDAFQARLTSDIRGASMAASRAIRYRGVDPVTGEFSEPVQIVPALSVATDPGVLVWPEGSTDPRLIHITVENSAESPQAGSVRLELPEGFRAEPASFPFELTAAGSQATFTFELLSSGTPVRGEHSVRAVAVVDGREYRERVEIVDYEHIPRTPLYHAAETSLAVFPVQVAEGLRLGYIMGSGDAVPDAIRQLGVDPELLDEADLATSDLTRFDVIVLGVRAYATRDDLRRHNDRVLQFARDGGTLIVQYNQYDFPQGGFAPYEVDISRPHDRVTVEEAPVRVLDADHPLASVPNRIADADFDGWVQERGLYFLGQWDDRYVPVLEMNDPGEDPKRGSLLVAPLGRGTYVYTGLSFFRQLPAGVPGAYRLFANLISLKIPGVS